MVHGVQQCPYQPALTVETSKKRKWAVFTSGDSEASSRSRNKIESATWRSYAEQTSLFWVKDVFFGLAMLDTWNPGRNANELVYGELAVALVLQRPLQERPKAVWHRHHQPEGYCWWWGCLNVCHLKRFEDGRVNSTKIASWTKRSSKKEEGSILLHLHHLW